MLLVFFNKIFKVLAKSSLGTETATLDSYYGLSLKKISTKIVKISTMIAVIISNLYIEDFSAV